MQLTTKGRYAVMAMVDLAQHSQGKAVPLAEIAARQQIALNYLEQIFAKLRKSGLVASVRGPGGGYVLNRETETLAIADIIAAVDERITMTRCGNPGKTAGCMHDKTRCLTHDLWDGLGQQIYTYLRSVSLADVCERRLARDFMQHLPATQVAPLKEVAHA